MRSDWTGCRDCIWIANRGVRAEPRLEARPSPAIRETGFSRSSQSYRNRVDNISQSCGLWMDCRFNAILTQFRQIASGLQPNAIDRPGIALPSQSDRNQSRNPRSCLFRLFAILPQSINSILQSCGLWINPRPGLPQANRTAMRSQNRKGSQGLHQHPG